MVTRTSTPLTGGGAPQQPALAILSVMAVTTIRSSQHMPMSSRDGVALL